MNSTNFSLKTLVLVGLASHVIFVHAMSPKAIKKETPHYIIDIKYPQEFSTPAVNGVIQNYIDNMQKNFLNELSEDADTRVDAPGKTGINVTYTIPYQTANALSVRFDVSIYHRGAAHPSNTVVVKNFIKGQEVQLAYLFAADANYLKPIATFCKQQITAKKISDTKWIEEGTNPTDDNYKVWHFTNKGLAIIFDSYQVAAYVYGEQTVPVPLSVISANLKPEVFKVVWGN